MKKASIRLGRSQRRRTESAFKSFKQFKPFKTSTLSSLIKKSDSKNGLNDSNKHAEIHRTACVSALSRPDSAVASFSWVRPNQTLLNNQTSESGTATTEIPIMPSPANPRPA